MALQQALTNALRYFPPDTHSALAEEFCQELRDFGHVYMYRFMPDFDLRQAVPRNLAKRCRDMDSTHVYKEHCITTTFRAFPISQIPANTTAGAAIIHMILNNLDRRVAQFPEELVTYGGNGQVFSNWAQVRELLGND